MSGKYKRMSDDDVEKLIKARVDHVDLCKTEFYKGNEFWLDIQRTCGLCSYSVDQLRLKWNHLYKKYQDLLSSPTAGSAEGRLNKAESWKWFELLHKFGQTQHVINPIIVISSVPGYTRIRSTAKIEDGKEEEVSNAPVNTTNKRRDSETALALYKKDSKRIKKENKCILNFLWEYSKNENIPFILPSQDSD